MEEVGGRIWTPEHGEWTRRRFLLRLAMSSAFGAAGLALLTSCSSDDDDPEGTTTVGTTQPSGSQPVPPSTSQAPAIPGFTVVDFSGGGTGNPLAVLRVAGEAPTALVAGFGFSGADTMVSRLVASSLYALDDRGQPVPADADSYTPNADLTEHVFRLREGLQWSDGTPYDAQTYVDSLLLKIQAGVVFNPPWLDGLYDVLFAGADASVLGIEAPDPRTLVLRSNASVSFMERFLASAGDLHPIPVHLFAAADDPADVLGEMTDPATFVGNGPYVLTEFTPASMVFERNANYAGGAPAGVADQIAVTVFESIRSTQSFNDFRTGNLDVATVGWNDIPALQSDADLAGRTTQIVWPNWTMIVPNHLREPLDDVRVRQALYLAIDRDVIASAVLYGAALPQHGLLSPGYDGYDEAFRPMAVSDPVAEAQRLLADAGFPGGEGFPELSYITYGDASGDLISQTVVGMWDDVLGITVQTQRLDPGAWYAAVITPGDPTAWGDLADGPWPAAFRDPADTFPDLLFNGGPVFHHNWAMSDELLAATNDALYQADPATRSTGLAAVNQSIMEEMPIIPIALLNDIQVRGASIAGHFAAYGGEYYGLRYLSGA